MQMLLFNNGNCFSLFLGGICVETRAHNIDMVIFNTRKLFSRSWLSFGYVQSTLKEGMMDTFLKTTYINTQAVSNGLITYESSLKGVTLN